MAKTYIYIFEGGETFTHDRPPTPEDISCIDQGLLSVISVAEDTACGVDQTGEEYDLPQCYIDGFTHPRTGRVVEYHTFS